MVWPDHTKVTRGGLAYCLSLLVRFLSIHVERLLPHKQTRFGEAVVFYLFSPIPLKSYKQVSFETNILLSLTGI